MTTVAGRDNGALWEGIIDTQTPIRLLLVNYCLVLILHTESDASQEHNFNMLCLRLYRSRIESIALTLMGKKVNWYNMLTKFW